MGDPAVTDGAPIPAHVPPGLVYDYDFYATPGLFDQPQWDVARSLHAHAPRIFFTPRNGGHWVVTRKTDIVEICRTPEQFPADPQYNRFRRQKPVRFLPKDYDPPEHTSARAIFAPVFLPSGILKLEPGIRALAAGLIEATVPNGGCEFVSEIAEQFPVTIFLRLADAPLDHRDAMLQLSHDFFRAQDPAVSLAAAGALGRLLAGLVAKRRANPGDDLISRMVTGDFMGRSLTDDEAVGGAVFTFLAGLDTVTATLSFVMKFLARNPDLYRSLVDDPHRIVRAVEELIRVSGVALIERGVREDMVFKDIAFKCGDRVIMLLQISGMDTESVTDPYHVDFDREVSTHLGFGAGAHRCLGSHLARLEIRIFLEEWVRRIPVFTIADDGAVKVRGGTVWSPETLPLRWAVAN
jgi:cytochrome P450